MRNTTGAVLTLAAIAALSTPLRAQQAVGCPGGKPLAGVEVFAGDPSSPYPMRMSPDAGEFVGPASNGVYRSETWTNLRAAPQPLGLGCHYSDGSVTRYALPSGVGTCTFYSQPQKVMACQ